MVAATAWDMLAAELGTAASGYSSVVDELTGGPWVGPSSAAMVSAVIPYVSWLGSAAGLAEESANQARAAAAAFEAAFAMTVPPPAIAANRLLLMTLVATNFFGQNTPAIMAAEAQYLEMWAQDAAAMYGYAASSAAASQLTRFISPPSTTTPDGESGQFAAVAQAAAEPAGNSGQATSSQLVSAAAVPQSLQQLPSWIASRWPWSAIETQIKQFLTYGLPTPANNWTGFVPQNYTTVIKQTLQAYFGVGVGNFGWSMGQQLTYGPGGATAGAGGAWYPTPQFAGLHLGAVGGVGAGAHTAGAVSASAGQAGKVGMLSVPANWSTPTSEATVTLAAAEEAPAHAGAPGAPGAPGNALLRGMPAGAVGRRTAGYGYTTKYGFRHSVLTRPPSAG
ncbi:putative PPE family protein PPE25 [Mycobacterium heidelbergense]|nr:putative PPE family protein PPE25 [Mycobacterium heidelbergense]